MEHQLQLEIPFPSSRLASIAMRVLAVDKELKTDQVKRTIQCDDALLKVHFESVSAKMLRVSSNSFLEMLLMVTRTMDQFDQVV
ncbi:CTAG/Pcc1 family [Halteromyces radiatus]|uniref:CTAG/Pcc1 family n=1 Tax=Halteromyces radiatus TaxID=101107 RepID=UPI00221E421C|nr:CTAG/Pcc1 family [Halteromyces radiatus]KAI8089015.1 CTAG/Pcc1 family [Halteromyces radiatus]